MLTVTALELLDDDVLSSIPEDAPAHLAQRLADDVLVVLATRRDDRGEVVSRKLAELRRERHAAVRDEDLALGQVTAVDDDLARCRMRRVVLEPDRQLVIAEWDPAALAAPAAVNQRRTHGQKLADRSAGFGRLGLPAGSKVQIADSNRQVCHGAQRSEARKRRERREWR